MFFCTGLALDQHIKSVCCQPATLQYHVLQNEWFKVKTPPGAGFVFCVLTSDWLQLYYKPPFICDL